MLEHTAEVVRVKLEPHPNADSLSLVMVDDFQCAVRTDDWRDGDLAVYIEPDSIVPDTPDFAFLNGNRRIKARRLRGEWSMGLLIPAPPGAQVGDDCMEQLGIEHYEPPIRCSMGPNNPLKKDSVENIAGPDGFYPVYDVPNFRKYSYLLEDGEEICLSEKLHGASARFVCVNDKMYCGSRKQWKAEDKDNLWWKAFYNYPVLDAWCRHNQGITIYAEVFGNVQNLKYGSMNGRVFVAAFDLLQGNRWLDFDEARDIGSALPWVPFLYRGPYIKEKVLAMAEEDSAYPGANHHREGVVVSLPTERSSPKIGRLKLKVVGNRYLAKS